MIKAVVIGFAHMHVNEVALYISEQPDFELAAAADVNAGEEKILKADCFEDFLYGLTSNDVKVYFNIPNRSNNILKIKTKVS